MTVLELICELHKVSDLGREVVISRVPNYPTTVLSIKEVDHADESEDRPVYIRVERKYT